MEILKLSRYIHGYIICSTDMYMYTDMYFYLDTAGCASVHVLTVGVGMRCVYHTVL